MYVFLDYSRLCILSGNKCCCLLSTVRVGPEPGTQIRLLASGGGVDLTCMFDGPHSSRTEFCMYISFLFMAHFYYSNVSTGGTDRPVLLYGARGSAVYALLRLLKLRERRRCAPNRSIAFQVLAENPAYGDFNLSRSAFIHKFRYCPRMGR